MTTTFMCDGVAGKIGVYTGTDDLPLYAPLSYLSRIKFHSDLTYPKIIGDHSGSVTLNATSAGSRTQIQHNIYAHGLGIVPWVLGSIEIGGQVISLSGTVPVQTTAVNAGATYLGSPGFLQTVSLGADATNVYIYEHSLAYFNAGYAALTFSWRILITDVVLS